MDCIHCGVSFVPQHRKGPSPAYCTPNCRQAAFMVRLRARQLGKVSDEALLAELKTRIDADVSGWTVKVSQLVAALVEGCDCSGTWDSMNLVEEN